MLSNPCRIHIVEDFRAGDRQFAEQLKTIHPRLEDGGKLQSFPPCFPDIYISTRPRRVFLDFVRVVNPKYRQVSGKNAGGREVEAHLVLVDDLRLVFGGGIVFFHVRWQENPCVKLARNVRY